MFIISHVNLTNHLSSMPIDFVINSDCSCHPCRAIPWCIPWGSGTIWISLAMWLPWEHLWLPFSSQSQKQWRLHKKAWLSLLAMFVNSVSLLAQFIAPSSPYATCNHHITHFPRSIIFVVESACPYIFLKEIQFNKRNILQWSTIKTITALLNHLHVVCATKHHCIWTKLSTKITVNK